jgi:hypothetical protein
MSKETTLNKNAKGYGYKYTDIAEIHEWLEGKGITYYQYIEPIEGNDYIMTVPIIDGKELPARRGCKVVIGELKGKNNAAQEQGSGITYARRYSLLMAFGLATADDDAESLTEQKKAKKDDKAAVLDEYVDEGQLKTLTMLLSKADIPEEKFCEVYKIAVMPEFPSTKYNEAVKKLEAAIKAKKEDK